MPDNDNEARKQPSRQRDDASNDNQQVANREGAGESAPRGEAITGGGNKVHGDMLEGMIPGKSQSQDDSRPDRDDGDDDEDRDDDQSK